MIETNIPTSEKEFIVQINVQIPIYEFDGEKPNVINKNIVLTKSIILPFTPYVELKMLFNDKIDQFKVNDIYFDVSKNKFVLNAYSVMNNNKYSFKNIYCLKSEDFNQFQQYVEKENIKYNEEVKNKSFYFFKKYQLNEKYIVSNEFQFVTELYYEFHESLIQMKELKNKIKIIVSECGFGIVLNELENFIKID